MTRVFYGSQHFINSRRTLQIPWRSFGVDLGIAKEACSQRITPCVEQTLESAQAVQTRNGVNRELQWPASSLEEAFDRLDIPASYCDIARQYACVQRYLLYTTAWLDWHVGVLRTYSADDYIQPNFSEFMGCITTSPVLVERLFKLKVPVWYLRQGQEFIGQEVIERQLLLTEPKKIVLFVDEGVQAFNESQWLGRVSITMLVGDRHIDWINREALRYLDKESRPLPTSSWFPESGPC
ncbi:hypothetical protein NM688_g5593 [Phlebia brevispora]|uniref:Uncharacterized protein n=1 Tax=Phlebia brevispora TaxID=194682 RepID=A0ACC1SSZ1_9APHY|nr:hypothetical protein NM688_g5593 [Phlebia brevispora]